MRLYYWNEVVSKIESPVTSSSGNKEVTTTFYLISGPQNKPFLISSIVCSEMMDNSSSPT